MPDPLPPHRTARSHTLLAAIECANHRPYRPNSTTPNTPLSRKICPGRPLASSRTRLAPPKTENGLLIPFQPKTTANCVHARPTRRPHMTPDGICELARLYRIAWQHAALTVHHDLARTIAAFRPLHDALNSLFHQALRSECPNDATIMAHTIPFVATLPHFLRDAILDTHRTIPTEWLARGAHTPRNRPLHIPHNYP